MLSNEQIIKELAQLKDDSICIGNDIDKLKNAFNTFIGKYKTERILGKVIQHGLEDNAIYRIEDYITSLGEMQNFFNKISSDVERDICIISEISKTETII